MKKILFWGLLLFLVLAAVLLIKTASFKSKQILRGEGKRIDFSIDETAVKHLSDAVKINTVSFDDTTVVNQLAFDSFFTFLKTQYVSVFENLEDTIINDRSLLLKWKGKNENLKPIILYAHVDVVPIEETTKSKWTHAPFSGEVADGFIWGRGTLDDKGSLISIFEALNRMQANHFTPARTIYFAFGGDEEVGGTRGAEAIAEYFRKQKTKFEFYIDEGGMVSSGLVPNMKHPVALIGTAEKGYITLELTVNAKGGHSSHPDKETALDILVNAVKKIHDNPEERRAVSTVNEFMNFVGPEMPFPLKTVFANKWLFEPLILNEYEKSAEGQALLRTTSALTILNAGLKENVIPSLVNAKINFRILPDESSAKVQERITQIVNDKRVIITRGEVYEPSHQSATNTIGFTLLQKTCAQVFPDAIVSPFLMLGSTDSKHFQDLTDNTYRFFPVRMDADLLETIHGINERIGVKDYMETIAFYETFIQSAK
ncbi:MAG: M20/M25/M40 family metallo-hydrolase [Bacteroidetes bacterium]|nr:M20/M25/M40 family metallo-hydrolase [Bacteroidota bacterium]